MNAKLVAIILIVFPILLFAQKDKEGSKDHSLVPRFKNAAIYDYEEKSFDLYTLPTGSYANGKYAATKEVEGKVYRIFYTLPTSSGTTYEIFSNYKKALSAEGATILFSCKNVSECGKEFWYHLSDKYLMPAYYGEDLAFLAANFSKDGKVYYITVLAGYGLGEQGYEIHVIEADEMQQHVSLSGIEKAMNSDGKMPFYGILFDTGSDILKPSATTELQLIAEYLKKNSTKKIYVVGHTDNTGNFEGNMSLSEKRALAVVATLVQKYGISNSRLKAVGVGPVAPVRKNTTDDGRKKNRRVEIVLNEI